MTVLAHYTLRRKNIPLVHFRLEAEQEVTAGMAQTIYQVHVTQVEEESRHLLPGMLREQLTDASLLTWIDRRKTPKNRQFVDQIMHAIADDENPLHYVDISHALSLNDAFWITNDDIPSLWKDFNLYSHPFDEVLAYVAFTGYSKRVSGVISSPELTSSGALKKCWSNCPNGIYLIKGDDFIKTEDGRSQATMEFYAAQIAEKMGFTHVPYNLEEFHRRNGEREIVCTCKLFIGKTRLQIWNKTIILPKNVKGGALSPLTFYFAQSHLRTVQSPWHKAPRTLILPPSTPHICISSLNPPSSLFFCADAINNKAGC